MNENGNKFYSCGWFQRRITKLLACLISLPVTRGCPSLFLKSKCVSYIFCSLISFSSKTLSWMLYDMRSYLAISSSAGHAMQFLQHDWVAFFKSSPASFCVMFHLMLFLTHRRLNVDAEIHPKDSFAMPRAIARIFSVWHLSYGLQLLLLLSIVLLLNTKQTLKIWRPCSTCMFGVWSMFCKNNWW